MPIYEQLYDVVSGNLREAGETFSYYKTTFLSDVGNAPQVIDVSQYLELSNEQFYQALFVAAFKRLPEEKEERRKFRRTELELDLYQTELMEHLKQYNITEPRRWLNQALAIIEPKEMVEIRHELIVRRQSLRKRMDYNKDVAGSARDEIMDVVTKYPEYADEIQGMVDRYEKMY